MIGYPGRDMASSSSDDVSNQDLSSDEEVLSTHNLYAETLSASHRRQNNSDDDVDFDYTYTTPKKTIMVGPDYQSVIPEGLSHYDDALPYENDDKLMWEPTPVSGQKLEDYLLNTDVIGHQNVNVIPTGNHSKDDEQALYLLLQCGYNMDEALRRRKMNVVPASEAVSLWSEEECRNFEQGLRTYGKDFHLIQQNKVRTRSVGEIVQFYYLWKKTERHDVFANKTRLEKKKYTLHPGITDYMDRLLDDQDSGQRDRSLSPMTQLIYGDPKRQQRNADEGSKMLSNFSNVRELTKQQHEKSSSLEGFLKTEPSTPSDSPSKSTS